MAKNIEPKLKKIGDYLKLEEDTVFTIPEYQRAYSWGIDNCDKLWQDINDFVESETKVSTKLENKTGYVDSEYPIARALVSQYQNANKPYWKKDDILSATAKASDRIVRFIFGE